MYRYREKECSDPLDLAYSILSISMDDTGVSVEYGISKTQLAYKILSHLGHSVCIFDIWRVLRSLKLHSWEEDFTPQPFVNVQARILTNSLTCEECSQAIWFQDLPEFIPSRTYVHCLECKYDTNGVALTGNYRRHLLLYDLNSSDESSETRWYLYRIITSLKLHAEIPQDQEFATVNLDGTSATIRFSPKALCALIEHMSYEFVPTSHTHRQEVDKDAHVGTGWSLAN
jgi:hypothetical protein